MKCAVHSTAASALAALVSFGFVVGCDSPPTVGIFEADGAVLRAKEAEAHIYFSSELRRIETILQGTKNAIRLESRRSFYERDYGRARALLVVVTKESNVLALEAPVAAQEAKMDARALLDESRKAILELSMSGRRPVAADNLERRWMRAEADFGDGRYLGVIDAVAGLLDEIRFLEFIPEPQG